MILPLPAVSAACDPVPADYSQMKNPVTLTEDKVTYYRKQFRTKCARCHGKKGNGGGEEASDQKVKPVNFTDVAFMSKCADGQLYYQIENGGEEKSAMPAFGPESDHGWSETKVWHMVAFIRRFAEGKE
jgi:mono/diheme cytochrome c family protein